MTIVKEVIDGLESIAKSIKNIKEISAAVKEGKKYLDNRHPDVKDDIKLMVNELRKSMGVVAEASAVLSRFRFTVSADMRSSELVRFNTYFIHHKQQAQFIKDSLEDLRGHCSKIREHAMKLTDSATVDGFARLFAKLGLRSPERERDLGEKLDRLAYEDFAVANSAMQMERCLDMALNEIQNSLGNKGVMHEENVPKAAALLDEYARAFAPLEASARTAANEVQELINTL